jgi:hypothetical protein
MARINSLQGRIKFPVPMRRELDRKPLNSAVDFGPIVALGGLGEQNSLYFPQPSREFGGFRDEFARDCLLQQRVTSKPDFKGEGRARRCGASVVTLGVLSRPRPASDAAHAVARKIENLVVIPHDFFCLRVHRLDNNGPSYPPSSPHGIVQP